MAFCGDVGAHATSSELRYKGNVVDTDTSGAATTLFRFNVHYNIIKWFSIGLDFRSGKYIEDAADASNAGNKIGVISLGLRFYPLNRKKFVLYTGPTFGRTPLTINKKIDVGVGIIPYRYELSGSHFGWEAGFNWYFVKRFGMNFGMGYVGHKYNLNAMYVNGKKQDLTDFKLTMNTKGVQFNLGLVFYFLKKDEN